MHRLNPQLYLERMLRLAPHWPTTRVLELSPKYWVQTFERLTPEQRAIAVPHWTAQDVPIVMQTPGEAVTDAANRDVAA